MILFKEDWNKYPDAIIHYETTNISFTRLAEIYYKMGVKNNAFHLSLLDPSLKDVDPHSDDLPIQIQARIVRECKNNPWYVFREIIRVPTPGSLIPAKFRADRSNIALYWLFFNHVMTLVVILRQTGKTTSLMSLVVGLLNFWTTNTFINFLTKSEGLKSETLTKVKSLFDELPYYLNFSSKKDIFNSEEVRLKGHLENTFKGNLSSASPKQAEKVGRGFTSPINIIDETAFIENIAIAMGAMLMSGNAAREYARQNNKPYGTILATTAGNIDDRDGSYVYNIWETATLWDEHLYDCTDEANLNETIVKNSNVSNSNIKKPIVNISLSYRQLGYDDEWLNRRLSENISTPENIARDLFNHWLSGSTTSPISKEHLAILKDSLVEQPRTEFYSPYNYLLRWYVTEDHIQQCMANNSSFIIGIDTSDAVGRDDIAFVMRDHTTGEVICSAVFNDLNLITLADFFVSFLIKYPNSTMIIERRSSAASIIDYIIQKLLVHEINPFTRLYNTIFQEKDKYKKEFDELIKARYYNEEVFVKYKKHIGFATSGVGITSRSELYSSTLTSMLKYTAHCTYDHKLISQLSALVIKNNRIDHPDGGNDDVVMAGLLSYWLLINGRNLNLYNIDTSSILKHNKKYLEEKYLNVTEDYTESEVLALETEFNTLTENYKKESNEFIAKQLESKIKKLAKELEHYNHVISVEVLMSELEQQRRLKRSIRSMA